MQGKPGKQLMLPVGAYGFVDLPGSTRVQNSQLFQHGSVVKTRGQEVVPCGIRNAQETGASGLLFDDGKVEKRKGLVGDEEEMNVMEDGADGHTEGRKGMGPWQRIKWTEKMVKLLITAVSYIGEDASYDCISGGKRKSPILQKIGKWKCVSKAMVERGYRVSPQQCEDKFNDLNKRYKRLNDILGRGTSCNVVENPRLLDAMDISEKDKEDVRRILSSKHLFYEEMCSYHNGNRLFLPHDPDLQRSLQLALRGQDDHEPQDLRRPKAEDVQDDRADYQDDEIEDIGGTSGFPKVSAKRLRRVDGAEDVGANHPLKFLECRKTVHLCSQNLSSDLNNGFPQGGETDELQKQWVAFRFLQLEEQKLQIKAQMLELENQQFNWQRTSYKHDRVLEKMRLENECIKLGNDRMVLDIKLKKKSASYGKLV